jgi:hypothetical protein
MFKKYTQCYAHTPGDKPFNESGLAGLAIVHGILPGVLFGALTGLVVGLAVGGPIGAVVGIAVGLFSTVTVGLALALTQAALQWRFHRLVCLTGVQCAVGSVKTPEKRGDLGAFDNDQFFDLTLMPYRREDAFQYATASDNFKSNKPGIIDPSVQAKLDAHPSNDVYTDGLQGQNLVRPSIDDLPYDTKRSWLHCEAEGDFWVRVDSLALALGLLAGVLAVVTVAAAAAGAAEGASIGCSIGGFFGPIGCLIGGIIGAIIGALLAGAAAGAISSAIFQAALQDIFDTDPGDIEDANVGDTPLGPLSPGDKLAVIGEHVYDGFHEGWHEIHPLMAVVRIGAESPSYLEWDPDFPAGGAIPPPLPGLPPGSPALTGVDMQQGLDSPLFRARVTDMRDRWCSMIRARFDENVATAQQGLTERWTIHPSVDGCDSSSTVIK